MNDIFAAYKRYWPKLWESRFSQDANFLNQTRRSWLRDLPEWIDRKRAERGLGRAHTSCEYPPSLAQFIKLCRPQPEDFNAPSASVAYGEACNSTRPRETYRWSHPAVYHAASRTGWFDLMSNTKKQMITVFEEHYKKIILDLDGGVELTHPSTLRISSSADDSRVLTRKENVDRLSALKNALFSD